MSEDMPDGYEERVREIVREELGGRYLNYGWVCPKCGTCNGPFQACCSHCSPPPQVTCNPFFVSNTGGDKGI